MAPVSRDTVDFRNRRADNGKPRSGPAYVSRSFFRFGDCRIDLSARELRRAGQVLVLPPKVFDCLAYLIERRERAVGRDELVAAVWGKTEITDTLLGQTILKARRAVGDSAEEQKAIRTIPRFGYAWVAEIASDPEATRASIESSDATAWNASTLRRLAWLATIVLLAVAGLWQVFRPIAHDVPVPAGSAAVLPVDVNAPAEWSWVRLGLMDAIASRLREGRQPIVPSDNVVALVRAAAGASHPPDVRAASGAALLVIPSATWSDSGWVVRLQLQREGLPIEVDARNVDVLLAGREATDRLLVRLGKTPPADAGDPGQWSDAQLLQRAEAALLTDDLDGARRLLQSAPESLKQSPEYALRLIKIDFRTGAFDAAEERLHALLTEVPAESDPVLRARVLNGMGHVAIRRSHIDDATTAYAEAASLLAGRAAPAELGQAYMGLGNAAQIQERYDQAQVHFSQAHIAFELAGDGLALARLEANEGMLDAARDRYASAVTSLERAARRFETFGTVNELAMTSSVEIASHLALLEPREALAASERAWPVRDRPSNPRIRHAYVFHRALALDANGRRREALVLLQSILNEADPAREADVQAVARGALARIALASGHAKDAVDLALAAMPALDDAGDPRDRLTTWLVATRALRAVGQTEDGARETGELAAWAGTRAQPVATLYASLAKAEQLTAERRDAFSEYDRALALASSGNVPADIAEVVVSYGTALLDKGELERATAIVGQAARWADRDFGCALLQVRLYSALGQRPAWEHAVTAARAIAGDRDLPKELAVFSGDL